MTADEALREIRGYAAANRVRLTRHARERMAARGAAFADIRHALANARTCRASTDAPGRWVVAGEDLDGDPLRAVVAIEDGVVVVTVF